MLTDPSPDAKSRSQGSTAAGIIESAAPYDMNESFPGLSYARGDDSRLGVGTGPATVSAHGIILLVVCSVSLPRHSNCRYRATVTPSQAQAGLLG